MTATVVLVHGAFHGGWCWLKVLDELTARGVPAVALDLPRQRFAPDAPAHRPSIRDRAVGLTEAVLDGARDGAVLVGHSAGGRVLTVTGAHPNVAHLVYLAAIMPPPDRPLAAIEAAMTAAPSLLGPALRLTDEGALDVDRDLAPKIFYNDCSEADARWATSQLQPEWLAPGGPTVLDQAPWRATPSTYVVCTEDQAALPEAQEEMAAQATTALRWASSHSPFLSQPALVADLLEFLARA